MGKKPYEDKPAQKGETPFQRFERLAQKVASAPKRNVDQKRKRT